MNEANRKKLPAIMLSLLVVMSGAISVATKHMSQGKFLSHVEPLRGKMAVLFGYILIVTGLVMLRAVWRSNKK